jgi:hypothetical protein
LNYSFCSFFYVFLKLKYLYFTYLLLDSILRKSKFLLLFHNNNEQSTTFLTRGKFTHTTAARVVISVKLHTFHIVLLRIFIYLCRKLSKNNKCSDVGFSHGLWPWKYMREGGAINRWKICKWKLKTSTTFKFKYMQIDERETNVTNDHVFRSVCSAYFTPIFAQIWFIAHEKIQDLSVKY